MVTAALMLGGNIGNTTELFSRARSLLTSEAGTIRSESGIYISAPWGNEDQQWFKNQALLLETALSPHELLKVTKRIESLLGREKGERNGPRTLDIDILLYGGQILEQPDLTIPHPRMHLRKFNLEPLSEIAGNLMHPVLHRSISELNDACTDTLEVKLMNDAAE